MQPFNFKVVPSDDDSATVPVSVAGQTMVDVQTILTDIGSMMIRQELRLQGPVPEGLLKRFDLSMDASEGGVDAVSEGEDTLVLDALNNLMRELELANMTEGRDQPGNHSEALARRRLAGHLVSMAEHLDGYDLYFGGEELKKFRLTRVDALRRIAEEDDRSMTGAVIGVISRDPVRRNRWLISNGRDEVNITFASNIDAADIPLFADAGPLIASGTVVLGDDGAVRELRNAVGCYSFPVVKFHRVITADRDIVLLNPVEAVPGYNRAKSAWTLDCEDLGISVSKPSWDECVVAFHEYFAFIWETYAESEDEFEGEEQEVRELLLSMAPVV